MQNVFELARYMHELGNIVIIEFKLLEPHQVLNISKVARDQVVHSDNVVALVDKFVAEVGAEKPGRACNQYSISHKLFFDQHYNR